MASNIYKQHYVDGTSRMVQRSTRQGRRVSLLPKASCVIAIHTTSQEKNKFREAAKQHGMSESRLAGLALFLGLRQLSVTDNCSTQ